MYLISVRIKPGKIRRELNIHLDKHHTVSVSCFQPKPRKTSSIAYEPIMLGWASGKLEDMRIRIRKPLAAPERIIFWLGSAAFDITDRDMKAIIKGFPDIRQEVDRN